MRKFIVLILFSCGWFSHNGYSLAVTPQTVLLAQQAFPVASGTLNDVATMSKLFPHILRLPVGIVKTGLAVLPGISMKGGMRDISSGLYAASVFTKGTLGLPFKVLGRSLDTVGQITPVALAGL